MTISLVTNSSVAIELVHSCSLPLSPPTHLEAVEVQETGPVLLRFHVTESSVSSSSHRREEEGVSAWHTQVHTPLHLLIYTPPSYSSVLSLPPPQKLSLHTQCRSEAFLLTSSPLTSLSLPSLQELNCLEVRLKQFTLVVHHLTVLNWLVIQLHS